MGQAQQPWQGDHGQQAKRPDRGDWDGHQPTGKKGGKGQRGQQGAAQVVDHLPAPDGGNGSVARDPWQQLPVTAHPAMLPLGGDIEPGGEILDHLDIRDQRGTGEDAFEQVMAEHGVVGHPALQRGGEGIDVIDTLASEGAFGEEVLIDVGNRSGIGFDAADAGEGAAIDRCLLADGQRGCHARLQDAVAFDDPQADRINPGAVHRVGHLADQGAQRVARQAGIGIEGDDKAHVLRHIGLADDKAGIGGPAQKAVKFDQLAPLALPSHPFALGRVPQPAAVQEQEARAALHRVAAVQIGDGGLGERDQPDILFGDLCHGIRPIGQQGEMNRAADAGEVMDFELFDLVEQGRRTRQEHRHGDEGAQIGGHAARQFHPRQGLRRDRAGDDIIDYSRGQFAGRPEREKCTGQQGPTGQPGGEQKRRDQGQGKERDGSQIGGQPALPHPAQQPLPQLWTIAQRPFQRPARAADQAMSRITRAVCLAIGCHAQGGVGDGEFIHCRAAGQFLDRGAIGVAGGEIHRAEIARFLQARVDRADIFEEIGPVEFRDDPHRGDDVAHGDIGGALPVQHPRDDILDGRILTAEAIFEPAMQRRFRRIEATQAAGHLRRKDFIQRPAVMRRHSQMQRRGRPACAREAVDQRIGHAALVLRLDDLHGKAAHVFHQHDAQGDGNGPDLADLQRDDPLIGLNEAAQDGACDQAVGMGDIGPGEAKNARVSGEMAFGQLGKLAVIAGRQIFGNLAQL